MNTQKIVLIVDGQVGKTTLVNILKEKNFKINMLPLSGLKYTLFQDVINVILVA